jgi:Zn-dependent protease
MRTSGWNFEWLGIPVLARPEHLLIAALFGYMSYGLSVSAIVHIPIVFLGVLFHEMGHALAGRRYGERPFIELNGWGGLTHWLKGRSFTRGQSIFVAFAGPLVGIVIGSAAIAAGFFLPTSTPSLLRITLSDIAFVNLGWALFNLVPIYPLDGGKIARDALGHFVGMRGAAWSHASSIGVGVVLIALALVTRQFFMVLMIGQLTWKNWQDFQSAGPLFRKGAAPSKASTPRAPAKKAHGFRVIEGGRKDDDEKPKYLN